MIIFGGIYDFVISHSLPRLIQLLQTKHGEIADPEVKQTSIDDEASVDQEDEGISNCTVVVLLLLLLCSNVNGGHLAYIAFVTACSAGCPTGTALTDILLCLAACQAICPPLMAASSL
ncbi:unnamed protein product [Rotaria magnacalcarata]|uniref:Uncharacterized protein n=1 Tax=Rotaria magnacalcarata TaxID=392030 RepID=A0A8S2Y5X3_9BILA|nr:unnamed protein product [Rotaria magnacalcarata]